MDIPNLEHVWNTNSLTVFGVLVALLTVFNWLQWKRNRELTNILLDLTKEVVPTNQAVLNFMAEVRDDLKEVREKIIDKILK